MIISKNIKLKANTRNIRKLRETISESIKINDDVEVPITFLTEGSHQKIWCQCDVCGNKKELAYQKYNKNISNGGYYSCSSKCSQGKVKKTTNEKWGTDYYTQTREYNTKSKKTNLEKWGSEYYLSSKTGKETISNTNLKKYGSENVFSNPEIITKLKKTNLSKYGVDNPSKYKLIKEKIGRKSKKTWSNKYKKHYKDKYDLDIISYETSVYTIKCKRCKKKYEINKFLLGNRLFIKQELCTICNPINSSKSGYEIQLLDFLKSIYSGNIIHNTRDVINPLELDFYIPELKIAIEFNGLYWHNELYKPNDYHYNKHKLCKELGIELFQIWEDDWLYKQPIIKSIINNKIGNNVSNKLYARKCKLSMVSSEDATKFLTENHLQGNSKSKINIGLYSKGELVSIMTFGRTRVLMGGDGNQDTYELYRFCNKINYSVIGGASKILKYFINKYDFKELISYYDKSFGFKAFYENIGFEFIKETPINYHYIKGGIRLHRYNFRKDKLVKLGYDPNMTANEITKSLGIYKIYGPGSYKYSLTRSN